MKQLVKLHLSVIFGWGVILFAILASISSPSDRMNLFVTAGILLSIRYSVLKPVAMLETIGAGLFYFSLWDLIFGDRDSYLPNTVSMILFPIVIILLIFTFVNYSPLSYRLKWELLSSTTKVTFRLPERYFGSFQP
ncbi:hypothetical protein [Tepidibacillus fermentans]|uniref:Uncharacterized protein n=1 Tax=Tepidibacillus fermentans TaxID=1281767 RepID=A0A4R3KKW9_9BACI|nr:hypothetical protein [Tepidibacillus fermentans]TCS84551.1 hypothetical protein EDD72_101220 [Tepidibacillus fermentans]